MIKNNKKSIYTILGIMTGTSMDGIDFSLIRTNGINYVKIIKEKSYNFSSKNQNDLKEIIDNKPKNINKLKDYLNKYKDNYGPEISLLVDINKKLVNISIPGNFDFFNIINNKTEDIKFLN